MRPTAPALENDVPPAHAPEITLLPIELAGPPASPTAKPVLVPAAKPENDSVQAKVQTASLTTDSTVGLPGWSVFARAERGGWFDHMTIENAYAGVQRRMDVPLVGEASLTMEAGGSRVLRRVKSTRAAAVLQADISALPFTVSFGYAEAGVRIGARGGTRMASDTTASRWFAARGELVGKAHVPAGSLTLNVEASAGQEAGHLMQEWPALAWDAETGYSVIRREAVGTLTSTKFGLRLGVALGGTEAELAVDRGLLERAGEWNLGFSLKRRF